MDITRIILRVADLDRSVDFWAETVGLTLAFQAGSFAFLDGGGVQLALNQMEGRHKDRSLTEIVFEVEDVGQAFSELSSRGVPFEVDLRPVTSDSDRDLLAAHFHDPDGHLASLTGWVARQSPGIA